MKLLGFIMLLIPVVNHADIFDDPKNLKVLDENIAPVELRQTMKMMAVGLGVRCSHCHVGEEGKSLRTYDFASDEKENKEKARFMLKMINDINHYIVTGMKDRTVKVECVTCHRGAIQPIQTVDLLKLKVEKEGVDKALSHYDQLRIKYFGSHTHNFTEWTLINLAIMLGKESPDEVTKILEKNLKLYPKSFQTLVNLGDVKIMSNDRKAALKYYKKAKKLSAKPQPWLEQKIEQIKSKRK